MYPDGVVGGAAVKVPFIDKTPGVVVTVAANDVGATHGNEMDTLSMPRSAANLLMHSNLTTHCELVEEPSETD